MKSLSCITLTLNSPTNDHPDSIVLYKDKDDTQVAVVGHKGQTKLQTIFDVLRCEWARPGRPASTPNKTGLLPSKHWSPLHYAAYHDRQAALSHFLRAGRFPDGVAGSTDTPLLVAVAAGHIDVVKILCAAGADMKAWTSKNGESALHLAIKDGHTDIMDILLSYEPDLEARTLHTRETPLHYAASRAGSLATVVTLLNHGAKYDALNSNDCTPAEVAITHSNVPAAVAMITATQGNPRELSKEKDMLLKLVEKVQNRFSLNNELISNIFEASCDPESTVLIESIKRNDAGLVEMFLEKGADPNRATATGVRPIFVALACASAQIVHLLAKHGVDVTVKDTEGLSVLQSAFEGSSSHDKEAILGIFDALLTAGADAKVTYPDGKTLLHHAVGSGLRLPRVAQRLLDRGVEIDQRDKLGSTALHYAGQSRSCLEVLLKYRADATLVNDEGYTPLLSAMVAATKEAEPDLEPLIKVSDLRMVDYSQRTPLHIAAERGLEAAVRVLLKHHAETTSTDCDNRTPLLLSVLHHQWSVVPLLATQPGINSWDENGTTALHHMVTSVPKPPATWKNIAFATTKFCERGVSRSMRDRSGATPLIAAINALPEESLPVIEALLAERGPARSNCVGHEDHKQRSALYFAATLEKPVFVAALLKHGAPFTLKEWAPSKGPIQPTTPAHKQTLKLLAEHDWTRRSRMLRRSSGTASPISILPKVLPVRDLTRLLSMGLDPNALPSLSQLTSQRSLLWSILAQTLAQPPLPPQYLQDVLKTLLEFGADANALASLDLKEIRSSDLRAKQLTRHPITFFLEQYSMIDIDLITLLLDNGADLKTASSYYEGRYPLHSAAKANRMDIVDEFLTRRATANPVDAQKQTPLFLAAKQGLWEVADRLLRSGAKVDVKDAEGNTPLHAAASGGSARLVACLLRAGAKALTKNDKKLTPRSCVPDTKPEPKDNEKITKMLKQAEEQERRDLEVAAERIKRQLEEEAIQEGKERRRKEREQALRTVSSTSQVSLSTPTSKSNLSLMTSNPVNSASVSSPTFASPTTTQPTQVNHNSLLRQQLTQPANPKPTANTQKPLPQPRVDSGLGHINTTTEKSLPDLHRTKKTFDSSNDSTENVAGQEELAGWLAATRMLDRQF